MRLLRRIREWFYGSVRVKRIDCSHPRVRGGFTVIVFGLEQTINKSPMCPACTAHYLEQHATRCASCESIIFPGEPVAVAWIGAKYPHTHLTFNCCASGGFYCGTWGEGRLISLHELNPEEYPVDTPAAVVSVLDGGRE